MPQTALIITEFDLHEGVGVIFKIRHSYPTTEELMKVIRRFIKDWGETEEGQQASQATQGEFDWGNFMEWRKTLRKRIPGVQSITRLYPDYRDYSPVIVDHSEPLMDRVFGL